MLERIFHFLEGVPFLYPIAHGLMSRLPARLLRLRLFAVYEIPLLDLAMFRGTAKNKPKASGPGRNLADLHVRWETWPQNQDRLQALSPRELRATWDGTSRRCAVAWHSDHPVGIVWIAAKEFHEQDLGISWLLAPDECWLFAAHVRRPYRGQGIFRALVRFVAQELEAAGNRRILLAISAGNRRSSQSLRGWIRRLAIMLAISVGGWRYQSGKGCVKRVSGEGATTARWGSRWTILAGP